MASRYTPAYTEETLAVLSRPPWKLVQGIANFRDIGGYPLKDGSGSVRRSFIYRSAEPSRITEEGKILLRDTMKVSHTYDLRSVPELKRMEKETPIIEIEGITRNFVPVFKDVDYSPENVALRFKSYSSGDLTEAYRCILQAGGKTAYRSILSHVLTRPDEPLLIHCTVGKDRTGVITALILLLAGVGEEVIAEEYALTTLGMGSVKEAIWDHLIKQPLFAKGDAEAIQGLENMLSSRKDTMLKTLKIIDEEFGGVRGYLEKQCGFSEEEIEIIRKNIVCDEPPCFPLK
ncbi:protein-tyrosine phosphatase-like protein [Tuber indicum]|nr:protein-tyrosine phosphatase-like protein [Tuber indicum]